MEGARIRKKPVKVTLNCKLLDEARALGLNISEAGEYGLRTAVEQARAASEPENDIRN